MCGVANRINLGDIKLVVLSQLSQKSKSDFGRPDLVLAIKGCLLALADKSMIYGRVVGPPSCVSVMCSGTHAP